MSESPARSLNAAGAVAAGAGAFAAERPTITGRLADRHLSSKASLVSPVVVLGTARLVELLAIAGLGLVIAALYLGIGELAISGEYWTATIFAGCASVLVLQAFDLYNIPALVAVWRQVGRIFLAWSTVFALLVAAGFLLKIGDSYSRVWLVAWYVSGTVLLIAGRIGMSVLARRWAREGRLNRRAVVVGGGPECETLLAALEAEEDSDIRICGIFDDRGDRISPRIGRYPKLGKVDELIEFTRRTRIDTLIVTLPLTAENRLLQILKKLWVLPVDIRLSAHSSRLQFRPRAYSYIGRVPFIDVFDKPIADWDYAVKWLFDKFVGTTALVLLAPVMLLAALAIRLDSKGPVLFRQKRYGFNSELIEVYKFRSMYIDKSDAAAAKLVTRDDPRVTRVGRFIRKTSLDELPQLINVVLGDLSLVGPRPHAVQAKAADRLYHDVVDGYFARHKVKPGITGWAQINGWRGETDTADKIQKRVEHDLYYIENWSVFLDIYILALTPFALMKTENAY